MGSRIEKFLIIQVHTNSNLNIKTRYDYCVALVPSDLFKLYFYCAQNQGCGKLKTVIMQGTKVGPGVINPWGVSLLLPLYLNHPISLILPLISWTIGWGSCQHIQAQRLRIRVQIELPDRKTFTEHCYQLDTLQNISLVLTHFLLSATLRDQYCYYQPHLPNGETEAQLMSGRAKVPSSDSTALPHHLPDQCLFLL